MQALASNTPLGRTLPFVLQISFPNCRTILKSGNKIVQCGVTAEKSDLRRTNRFCILLIGSFTLFVFPGTVSPLFPEPFRFRPISLFNCSRSLLPGFSSCFFKCASFVPPGSPCRFYETERCWTLSDACFFSKFAILSVMEFFLG